MLTIQGNCTNVMGSSRVHSTKDPGLLVMTNLAGPHTSVRPEAEIILAMARLGFRVVVMTPFGGAFDERARGLGIELLDHRPPSKFHWPTIALTRRLVKERGIDIVQAFNGKALGNAAWALTGLQTKLVGYRGYSNNIYWYDPSCYAHFLHPRVDAMVCLSESVRDMFLKAGMSASKAITIHKGHSASWYEHIKPADLSRFGITSEDFTCAFVANSRIRMKGVMHLVDALSVVPRTLPLKVMMIGRGLDQPEVLDRIKALSLQDKFIFTGFQEDSLAFTAACNFALSASVFGEATQKAMVEALFLKKPVIMTDIPGNRGMVVHGETGFTVSAGSPSALAQAIGHLVSMSHGQRMAMGQRGFEHISTFLNHDQTVREYVNLYHRLIEKG